MAAGFVAVLVGSVGAAYVASSRSGRPTATAAASAQVYVTAGPVDAGTSGAAALNEGRITTKTVPAASRPADAVSSPADVSTRVAGAAIPAGVIVTNGMFVVPQTRIGTIVIPPGKRALALELAPVPGVAGFAGAGDHIDVYGVAKGDGPNPQGVRLVLQGVEVLNVNGAGTPPAAQAQAQAAPSLIYLLAVTPVDAERLIYLTEFEKLYFDLVPNGEAPVKTPGEGPSGVLAV